LRLCVLKDIITLNHEMLTANRQPSTILGIHYLPCISWFQHFLFDENVVLDQHEYFVKQSYRNRSIILSANGPLPLIIPVKKNISKQPINTIEIENAFDWQKQHWEAIRSAYNSSPFFEHYEHYFYKFYHTEFKNLLEFNLELIKICLKLMKVEKEFNLSVKYVIPINIDKDLREIIHPKKKVDTDFKPYIQVFVGKFSFVKNLSIIDVIFNHGNDAINKIRI